MLGEGMCGAGQEQKRKTDEGEPEQSKAKFNKVSKPNFEQVGDVALSLSFREGVDEPLYTRCNHGTRGGARDDETRGFSSIHPSMRPASTPPTHPHRHSNGDHMNWIPSPPPFSLPLTTAHTRHAPAAIATAAFAPIIPPHLPKHTDGPSCADAPTQRPLSPPFPTPLP